jgi:prepilin peptidase CpaA
MISPGIYTLLLIELLLVAWIDLQTKKISNYWSIANFFVGVFLVLLLPLNHPFSIELLYFPVGFVVIGFCLFLAGIMGAGDSKFIATFFLMIPVGLHLPFFEKLLISTILVGALLLLFRVSTNFSTFRAYLISRHFRGIRELVRSRFSYAPVILLAWVLTGLSFLR